MSPHGHLNHHSVTPVHHLHRTMFTTTTGSPHTLLTFAPCAISSLPIVECPFSAAMCSAVAPSRFGRSTKAPQLRSSLVMDLWKTITHCHGYKTRTDAEPKRRCTSWWSSFCARLAIQRTAIQCVCVTQANPAQCGVHHKSDILVSVLGGHKEWARAVVKLGVNNRLVVHQHPGNGRMPILCGYEQRGGAVMQPPVNLNKDSGMC